MNKKTIMTCSLMMSMVLAASAYAAPGDCDKMVKGTWTGTVTTHEGGNCLKYPVGTVVKAYFDPYEVQADPKTGTACNLNWVGSGGPVGPQDSSITLGSDPQALLTPSSILPELAGAANSAVINWKGTSSSYGELANDGSYVLIHPTLTNGCALRIQLNK